MIHDSLVPTMEITNLIYNLYAMRLFAVVNILAINGTGLLRINNYVGVSYKYSVFVMK